MHSRSIHVTTEDCAQAETVTFSIRYNYPSVMRSPSLGVVENNAERVTVSRPDAADAMAEIDAIHPACPLHRALMHREQHAVPLP